MIHKACPVVLAGSDILAFRHPLAGLQLVKGTVEEGEAPWVAALRELAEESGILDAKVRDQLGQSEGIQQGEVWHFWRVACHDLPSEWTFHTEDDGGHAFAFFWHPLHTTNRDGFAPRFQRALTYIADQMEHRT